MHPNPRQIEVDIVRAVSSDPPGVSGTTLRPTFVRLALGRLSIWTAWAVLALTGAAVLLALAVAWRLSVGPVDVTRIVRAALPLVHAPAGLSFDRVRVEWSQDRRGPPLLASIGRLGLAGDDGVVRERLAGLQARFSPSALIRLDAMPASVRVDAARITLRRGRDGAIGFEGLASRGPATAADGNVAEQITRMPAFGIARLDLVVHDEAGGTMLSVTGGTLAVARGGGSGEVRLPVVMSGESRVITARLTQAAGTRRLDLDATPLPASLLPMLGASSPFDGSVGVDLHAGMLADFTPVWAHAVLTLGEGRLVAGGAATGLRGGRISLAWQAERSGGSIGAGQLSLEDCVLRLAAPGAPDGIALRARGSLAGDLFAADGRLEGALQVSVGRLDFAQMRALWPVHAAYWGRVWVAANLPAGIVSGADLRLGLASASGLRGIDLASAQGSIDVVGAVVRWLAPIEPATGVAGRVTLVDADHLAIVATAGRLHKLDIAGTTMRIAGLNGPEQDAAIDAHLAGSVTDLVWVLGQKRLHLDAGGGAMDLHGATGTVEGNVRVSLPLADRVRMDQIGIVAVARFDRLHLDDVALGRPIDDGTFALHADQAGLALDGHARFAGLAVSADLALDFRPGPGDAASETASVETSLDGAAIERAVPSRVVHVAGTMPTRLVYRLDHDRRGTLAVHADLGPAVISTGFGWRKPAGAAGEAGGTVVLDAGKLTSIPEVRVVAPGLAIEAHGSASGGCLDVVALDRIVVGRTRASGTIALPRTEGGALRVRLQGETLDLAPILASRTPGGAKAPAQPHAVVKAAPDAVTAWSVQAGFDRVELAHGLSLTGVSAMLSGGGGGLSGGTVTAAGPSPVQATLASAAASRHVSLEAGDTGALLRGLGVTSRLSGGSLALEADVARGGGPLQVTGKARLRDFYIVRTPLAARLLRDMTIYGLADRSGQGRMKVDRLAVPFRVADDVLHIDELHAWQLALGITASGTIGLRDGAVAIDGTVIPAYAINALPGRLPLIGRLFSPEHGGGVFAARYRIGGNLDHPAIRFDALAALVPGALRDLLPP